MRVLATPFVSCTTIHKDSRVLSSLAKIMVRPIEPPKEFHLDVPCPQLLTQNNIRFAYLEMDDLVDGEAMWRVLIQMTGQHSGIGVG